MKAVLTHQYTGLDVPYDQMSKVPLPSEYGTNREVLSTSGENTRGLKDIESKGCDYIQANGVHIKQSRRDSALDFSS